MKIAVIGSGYVGLVAAACFCELGHDVTCVDNDAGKLKLLREGQVPIHEEFLPELIARHHRTRLHFSGNLAEVVHASTAVFIAVGTPSKENGEADLSYVESVARELSQAINGYKVIITKSTVPVYTSKWIRQVLLLNGASSNDFDVVSNPEFLREGKAITDFLFPDRIVIGVTEERAVRVMDEIYAPLSTGAYYLAADSIPAPTHFKGPAQVIYTSAASAELIKHAANAFLAMKISFINAVANLCEAVNADIEDVCKGLGSDSRIGPRFLRAGIGYGGSCFPKDVAAFRSVARNYGCEFGLLEEVERINSGQRARFMRKVRSALWTLKGKKLGVLGISYKCGTDDVRESPAVSIIHELLAEGAEVKAFDPAATGRARQIFGSQVTFANDAYEVADNSDALLILTDWEEFSELDLNVIREKLNYPIVIDGRNLYNRQKMSKAGLVYHSIGRPSVDLERLAAASPGLAC
ncbi:MAG TPA: UDP-glucose/GDP-mannose dehydrogenase family protein [Terriglobales bacterium]|nr:UDP-glucose/GDP-mannose dehydrogenase family protein [Terriglobales bacterium]